MKQTAYFQKLRDPRWQKLRLEALEARDWACEVCFDSKSTLHVHHKQYFKGREPWEYDLNQLAVLCEHCHEDTHATKDRLLDVISRLPIDGMRWIDRDKAACLIAGAMGLQDFDVNGPVEESWFHVGLGIQGYVDERFEVFKTMPQPVEGV